MSAVTQQQVEEALGRYIEPYLGKDLISAKAVKQLSIEGGKVVLSLELGFPFAGYQQSLEDAISSAIRAVEGVSDVELKLSSKIIAHTVQKGLKPFPNIKNIIAVASGKGGVGKSTTSVNLALALASEGAVVGLLDADIYGPSQPRMLGSKAQPDSKDGRSMEPVVCHGLQSMSIGYLIDDESPMIWRGPMVTQALEQLLRDTNWQSLDYLVIDLPPGTGDVQLTLAQKIPVTGAVIVTTPQDIALLDARKGLKMFEKVEVPVLGIIENMSTHICSKCGHEEAVFGAGGGDRMASQYKIDMLGALPLDISIRKAVDDGSPTVIAEPDSKIAEIYRHIARRIAAKMALQARDYTSKFPNIVVQNT